jgi:hypothetical protein
MPESITEDELKDAMNILGWGGPISAARIFSHILNRRVSRCNPQVNGSEAVTVNELEAAFNRLGYTGPLHVQRLVKDILEHRKPEFEPGDIVLSVTGKVYILEDHGYSWRCPADDDVFTRYGFNCPAKPLVKIGVAV